MQRADHASSKKQGVRGRKTETLCDPKGFYIKIGVGETQKLRAYRNLSIIGDCLASARQPVSERSWAGGGGAPGLSGPVRIRPIDDSRGFEECGSNLQRAQAPADDKKNSPRRGT